MTQKILSNLPNKCLQHAEADAINVVAKQRPLLVGGLSRTTRQNIVLKIWWPKIKKQTNKKKPMGLFFYCIFCLVLMVSWEMWPKSKDV